MPRSILASPSSMLDGSRSLSMVVSHGCVKTLSGQLRLSLPGMSLRHYKGCGCHHCTCPVWRNQEFGGRCETSNLVPHAGRQLMQPICVLAPTSLQEVFHFGADTAVARRSFDIAKLKQATPRLRFLAMSAPTTVTYDRCDEHCGRNGTSKASSKSEPIPGRNIQDIPRLLTPLAPRWP